MRDRIFVGGQVLTLTNIPIFRSGAASYQNYLVADLNTVTKQVTVTQMACPDGGAYAFTGQPWTYALNDTLPNPPLPVPPLEGFVTFFNEGGFEAIFGLEYVKADGTKVVENTGKLLLGNKKSYYIPPYATDVRLGSTINAIVSWPTVFDLKYTSAPNKCYKLYGTIFSPQWSNDCD